MEVSKPFQNGMKFGAMLGTPKFKENNEVHCNMNFVKF
jgi:hypothetical protein